MGSPAVDEIIQRLRLYKRRWGGEEAQAVGRDSQLLPDLNLAASTSLRPERVRPKRAAVLICLFEGERGELRVLLTKRSSTLSTHAGEVALPGGKAEEGDADDGETALREAKEEIGLDPGLVKVITFLEPFLSKHLLRVVPVIGILFNKQAFRQEINPAEVEAIFDVPLEMFLKDENRQSMEGEWKGEKILLHAFEYKAGDKEFIIWGLTSSILIHAASVVYARPPAFPEHQLELIKEYLLML